MSNPNGFIAYMRSQVGYHEGKDSHGDWDNVEKYAAIVPGASWVSTDHEPWCAIFTAASAIKGGVGDLYPMTASTDTDAAWFKQRGQFSEYPSIGAQVFYGHDGDMDHTGGVVDFDDTYVYTIEGNSNDNGSAEGDGVYAQKRLRRDSYIQGYGHPAFTEPVRSADPHYKPPAASHPVHPVPHPTGKPAAGPNHVAEARQDLHEAEKHRHGDSLKRVENALDALKPAPKGRK